MLIHRKLGLQWLTFLLLHGIGVISMMAQTTVSGGIFTNTTWTLAGSPYHVVDDVILFDSYTLTIEPGVLVQAEPGKTIELRNSRLIAVGTDMLPIIFEKAGVSKWGGFKAVGTANPLFTGNQVQMEYCIGRDAIKFMDLDIAYHTPYNFINCEFSDNTTGFWGGPASFVQNQYRFELCDFHDNSTALHDGFFYTVSNCTFQNNNVAARHGYWVVGCTFAGNTLALSTGHYADNNTFVDNVVAVEGEWSGSMTFTNNVVIGNGKGVRMGSYFNGSSVFLANTICGNTVWNIERYSSGSNNAADISGNCFCTDDPDAIEQSIYHAVDDLSVGLIVVSPFSTDAGCLNFQLATDEQIRSGWLIHPNPVSDFLYVNLEEFGSAGFTMALYDGSGRVVLPARVHRAGEPLDLRIVSDGTYHLVIQHQGWKSVKTLIVLH